MPLPTPLTTEAVAARVIATMTMTLMVSVGSSITPIWASPAVICCTPSPSDVATPATVPTTAITSTASPRRPLTRSPKTGSRIQRSETERPLR